MLTFLSKREDRLVHPLPLFYSVAFLYIANPLLYHLLRLLFSFPKPAVCVFAGRGVTRLGRL